MTRPLTRPTSKGIRYFLPRAHPNAPDATTPKFANNDEHVAAVMAAGGFGVLNVNGHRR